MSKDIILLLEILSNEHVYSLNKLKIKLNQNKLNLSEEEIILLIVRTLYESICYLKMNKIYNQKNLYKCFKYLNASNNIKYLQSQQIIDLLNNSIKKINKKIDNIKFNFNNIVRDNICFLLKIKDNIELTMIQISIPKIEKYNNADDINKDSKDAIENTLYYFIFEIKRYNYIYEIFKTFPELVNFRTSCNKYILDDIITKYLECLNNPNSFDELYYEKIIDLFIASDRFKVTNAYKDRVINRLLLAKKNLSLNDFSKRKNKRIRFFLTDTIEHLKQFDIVDKEQFFSNINYRYGIQDTYSGGYYDRFLNQNYIDISNNVVDLTNRYTFTIDSNNTKSYDDAFSLIINAEGNYELDVYISDLSNYVKEYTKLDELALKKSATIYLPDYTLTMLPHSLTYENCSLIKNSNRNVIAHRFVLSQNFDIISFDIKKGIINVDDNFSYKDVNDIVNSDDVSKLKIMRIMSDIANSMKHNGLYNNDYHIIKTLKKKYSNIDDKLLEKYENLNINFVDTFMILTNYFVSDLFLRLNFPFIYRVNTSNVDLKLIEQIKETTKSEASNQILECIQNLYNPSYYSEYNLGHNGLNLPSYSHITTPIRNYAALLSQRLECKYLINNNVISDSMLYDDEEKISKAVAYINDRIFYNDEYISEYKQKTKIKK